MRIVGEDCPNMPWMERHAGGSAVMWRDERNPIIARDGAKEANSIFNSAVVPFRGRFAGVFRCDDTSRRMNIRAGFSDDGLSWRIEDEPIAFESERPGYEDSGASDYKYDPRVAKIGDSYYITWCNGYHGPTIGLGRSDDFRRFVQLENATLPYNRNGVLFPRKIGGMYMMLSRPSDTGHTPFGDIFLSKSPDLRFWGEHRHVMGPSPFEESAWQCMKIGAGPVPIETSEGWLLFYHGVLRSCSGYVYSFGAALLDLDEPWKVIARIRPYLLSPREGYELSGDVPNVVFPCAALSDARSGRIAVYYGAADTVTGLAYCRADEVYDFLLGHSL